MTTKQKILTKIDGLDTSSAILGNALASVHGPIMQFVETGIYSNPDYDDQYGDYDHRISNNQVRRVARFVAKELKRPFIEMTPVYYTRTYHGRKYTVHEPMFRSARVFMPKRKYLMPLVTPLLLAEGSVQVLSSEMATLWNFRITDEDMWKEYRAAMDRPEMRKARKLE